MASSSPRGTASNVQVNQDTLNPNRGANKSEIDIAMEKTATHKFIEYFWNHPRNQGVKNAFMDNKIIDSWAGESDKDLTLKKQYLDYCIQDYFYLVDFIKFKALRLVSIPQTDMEALRAEVGSIGNQFQNYVDKWFNGTIVPLKKQVQPELANLLGEQLVAKVQEEIQGTDRSVAELAYANFLQNNANHDDWFNTHVIMIACTYVSDLDLFALGDLRNRTAALTGKSRAGLCWPSNSTTSISPIRASPS